METPIKTFVTMYMLYPSFPCAVRRRRSAARGVWGGCCSPCPCHRCRRASSAHSRTHSHTC
eukprot:scaffold101099_cov30-Phaeocystis_antarctica.AAC.1